MYLNIIFVCMIGFLSGSILYAKILPQVIYGVDITKISEDGNPGTSNVFKYCGKKCGILTSVLEFAKGFFPVLLGNCIVNVEQSKKLFGLIIIAPVLGHIFSFFNGGNGGIGIAPTCGTLIAVFLRCRLLIVLTSIYAVAKFILKFKHQYQRTLFVFGTFMLAIVLMQPLDIYRQAYLILSIIICGKCLLVTACNRKKNQNWENLC